MSNALHDLLFPPSLADTPVLMFPDAAPLLRADFAARSAAMAAVLAGMGLQAGMRLVVQTEKSADLVALYGACVRMGVVFVPLNPALPLEETLACMRDTAAVCAIVAPDRLARLRQMTGQGAGLGASLGTSLRPDAGLGIGSSLGSSLGPSLGNDLGTDLAAGQHAPANRSGLGQSGQIPPAGHVTEPFTGHRAHTPDDNLPELAEGHSAADLSPRIESLSHDGTGSFADLTRIAQDDARPVPPVAKRAAGDAAVILYTNATGLSRRGVVLSQGALVQNTRALVDLWQITPDDILCHALPLHQAYGLTIALHVALAGGAAVMFMHRYDPATLGDTVAKSTVFMGVPSFYGRLLAQNDVWAGRFDKVRLLLSGTAPLPADTHAAFVRLTGHAIADRFALTETGVIAAQGGDAPHTHGQAGPALSGVTLRITDEDGHPLPPATTGLIEVQSPALSSGYITPNGLEAPALREGGWYVTGELGHLSPSGILTLVGKAQEQILSGGFSVDPAEVETALSTLADVKDCAVIGLPHPAWGEIVIAVVVPKAGSTPDPEEMLADLGYALARFKRPRHVVFVDDLPRNALGRVRKDALRAQVAGQIPEL